MMAENEKRFILSTPAGLAWQVSAATIKSKLF